MTGRNKSHDISHQPRRDSMYEERVHDPYVARGKYVEPTRCPDCGAVYLKGRWQWGDAPSDAAEHRCPACARVHDRVPAGVLTISGRFFSEHHEEISHLIHNMEQKEKTEHPLERIMDTQEKEGTLVIHFTGQHLTRTTAEALYHAYKGDIEFHHTERDDVMHASWHRA